MAWSTVSQYSIVSYSLRPISWTPTCRVSSVAKRMSSSSGNAPVELAVRPGDVAVKRDGHGIGHAAHQAASLATGSEVRLPDAADFIATRGTCRGARARRMAR